MFAFMKTFGNPFGFGLRREERNENEFIEQTFSHCPNLSALSLLHSDDTDEGLSSANNDLADNLSLNDLDLNGFVENGIEENDGWNEEWKAYEDDVNQFRSQLLDNDNKCLSFRGIVNQVVSTDVIVADNQRIKYDHCSYGEPSEGDIVIVETNSEKFVSIKPLRFKILTGKITDNEKQYNRLIFGRHAFLKQSSESKHLRVGDVVKVIVIESKTSTHYHWRAILFNHVNDPELSRVDEIQAFTNELLDSKNGIEIIDKISFGEMKFETKKSIIVWIKNKGMRAQTLQSCDSEEGENQVEFSCFQSTYGKRSSAPYVIPAQKECFVELICNAKYCGDHNELLVFKFEDFRIGRFITFTVFDYNAGNNRHNSRTDYNQFRRRMFGNDTWIVPGERVWQPNKHIYDKLEKFRIPEALWRAIDNNWPIEEAFPEITEPLDKLNYQKRFHALVYLEETENQINLQKYNLQEVTIRREGRFLALTVPGLADGRPSLIISDKIILFDDKTQSEDKNFAFEGFIHEIRRDDVMLRFNDEFHKEYSGGSFKVIFQQSRTTYRRCHHAITLASHMVEQVLFPNKVLIKQPYKQIPIESINWFNKSLNIRQKLAVVGALRGESRPTPFIIFGPPGTGKTVTIVESILQVFDKIPQSRVIACTSANSSADLIAAKLLESGRITESDLIRVTALHRINSIPESVRSVTQIAEEDEKKWLYHRVIVTTTSQAGVVFKYKISPSHFTHVFIDEAAQVIEPESLIPISMSVIGHGVVVLAGDHCQLGPVVVSQKAKSKGLDRSLMERLMECCAPYGRDEEKFKKYGSYNPKFVTKLVNNYRTDAIIMSIPSKLFYKNELVFMNTTDEQLLQSLNCKSALTFIGVKGEDRQDPDCPSWYNPQEIIQTCSFLDKLYQAGVEPQDIGIITPYRKQVTRLRSHIQDMGLNECKVATIEEFQGLEKRVILVTMVRSSHRYMDHDMKYNLGFIHNPKRFNVAVSRAMALLVCVGDPDLLIGDKCWSKLINYCIQNDSYSGCAFREYSPKAIERKRSKIMG